MEQNKNKNEVALQRKVNNYVNKYNQAMVGCEKSAWKLCQVVYETVNATDFEDVFGTMANYAKALNVSKGSLSKYYKAFERRQLLIEENETNANYGVSQIAEFSTIEIDETIEFVEVENVTPSDTVSTIREKVKHYLNGETTEEPTEEPTEETAEPDENFECMLITYRGVEYQITTEEVKAQIKKLLEIED